jgi:hypothetical protein
MAQIVRNVPDGGLDYAATSTTWAWRTAQDAKDEAGFDAKASEGSSAGKLDVFAFESITRARRWRGAQKLEEE